MVSSVAGLGKKLYRIIFLWHEDGATDTRKVYNRGFEVLHPFPTIVQTRTLALYKTSMAGPVLILGPHGLLYCDVSLCKGSMYPSVKEAELFVAAGYIETKKLRPEVSR